MKTKYMMATKAIHLLGDISRENPDLCIIRDETNTDFIGEWITGYGFIDVKFPKETTRELTNDEIDRYHGSLVNLSGIPLVINIKDEAFNRHVSVTNKRTGVIRRGVLTAPLKKCITLVTDSGYFISSRIKQIDGNEITTQNSIYIVEDETVS
jgi:hypothetical protein